MSLRDDDLAHPALPPPAKEIEQKRSCAYKARADRNNHQQGLPRSHQYADPGDQREYPYHVKPHGHHLHLSPPCRFTLAACPTRSEAPLAASSDREQTLRLAYTLQRVLTTVIEGYSRRGARQSPQGIRHQHLAWL